MNDIDTGWLDSTPISQIAPTIISMTNDGNVKINRRYIFAKLTQFWCFVVLNRVKCEMQNFQSIFIMALRKIVFILTPESFQKPKFSGFISRTIIS